MFVEIRFMFALYVCQFILMRRLVSHVFVNYELHLMPQNVLIVDVY